MSAVKEVKETREIALVREESRGLAVVARDMVISDGPGATHASGMLTFIADAKRKLEAQRVFLVKPLNDHVKNINAVFKEWAAPLLEADVTIRRKMLEYHVEEQKRFAEETKANVEEFANAMDHDAVPADLPAKIVRSESGGSTSVRKTWAYEVEDQKLIPRAFLMVDDGLINLAIKDGTRKIKGLRIYQKESLSVRS